MIEVRRFLDGWTWIIPGFRSGGVYESADHALRDAWVYNPNMGALVFI